MTSRHDPRFYACEECRHRKQKCSKDKPSCKDCRLNGRKCMYSNKKTRSPLQRRHMNRLESRLNDYQRAFQFMFPGSDPETLVDFILELNSQNTSNNQHGSPGSSATGESVINATPLGDQSFDISEVPSSINHEYFDHITDSPSPVPVCSMPLTPPNTASPKSFDTSSPLDFPSPSDDLLASVFEERLIDSYFDTFHHIHPFIQEIEFRQLLEQSHLIAGPGWQITRNTILAIGALYLDNDTDLDTKYYEQARDILASIEAFRFPSFDLLKGLLLLTAYAHAKGLHDTFRDYISTTVIMAVNLGLNQPDMNGDDIENRQCVWRSIHMFDAMAADMVGRPHLTSV